MGLIKLHYYLAFVTIVACVKAANILDLMGCASPSHHIWHMALVNGLAAKGHNITVLSTDVDPKAPKNVHYVHLEGVYDFMYKEVKVDLVALHTDTARESVLTLNAFGTVSCMGIIKSKGLQQMLNYPNDFKFDLIIYDYTLGPCLLGFLHKFNYPPVVGVTAFNIPSYTKDIVGGHIQYAYTPYFGLNYDSDMNIFQRINNIFIHMYDYFQRNYYYLPSIDEMARKFFDKDCPYLPDLEFYTRIALVNAHPAIDFPEPLPPNIIPVGGLQVNSNPKPLPQQIEQFINSSQSGAILFSLGTNVRSDKLCAEKQKMILDAFAQMPEYNFLWKYESDNTLPSSVPKNVLITPWLPQNDILAHKKVKAFISHCGTLSTHEATWHAVPMIGIPFFVDQVRTLHKSIKAGVAEPVLYQHLTTEKLVQTVRKVAEDPSYRDNMQIRSKRFRDQPESPLERAIWWVEYILRDPNPDHLESPTMKLGILASNLYDIILLAVVLIFIIIALVYKCVNRNFSKIDYKKKNK